MVTVVPQTAVAITAYEFLKASEDKKAAAGELSDVSIPVVASALTSVVCHPLDSLRKRMMLSTYSLTIKPAIVKPFSQTISQLQREGWGSLYNGFLMNLARITVWFALVMVRDSKAYKSLETVE